MMIGILLGTIAILIAEGGSNALQYLAVCGAIYGTVKFLGFACRTRVW